MLRFRPDGPYAPSGERRFCCGNIAKEKFSFPDAHQGRFSPRNLGIPGMGKPGRSAEAQDRVGPIPGIP